MSETKFRDWMYADSLEGARAISGACECGASKTYPKNNEYFHSYWCPLYKEKPKDDETNNKKESKYYG